MTERTRRTVLAGAGAGMAALAGCSAIPGTGGNEEPEYDEAALRDAAGEVDSLRPPDAFPVTLTRDLPDRHRERARTLLAEVPESPDFPNESVASELADERSSVAADLEADAAGRPLERLDTWRRRRGDAARVRGTYLAASGDLTGETVTSWRDQVRSTVDQFERDWEYRGSDPVEAAVVHAALEEYVEHGRSGFVAPRSFPTDPVGAPFRAGRVAGDVERAAAAVVDAAGIRARYRDGDSAGTSHRDRLANAGQSLRRSLSLTTDGLERYLDDDASPLPEDVADAPAGIAVRDASRRVRAHREGTQRSRGDGRYAGAVIDAGRGLVAAEALEALVTAVDDGDLRETPAVADVRAARERAVDSLKSAWATDPQPLAVELAVPALQTIEEAARRAREGYGGPARPYALFVLGDTLARVVPEATTFVADRLRSPSERT